MSKFLAHDWDKLRRLGKYLKGKARFTQRYRKIPHADTAFIYKDDNWAGDRRHHKYTFVGCAAIGPHWTKSCSKAQQLVAISSAESELYVAAKASAEATGIQPMARDMDIKVHVTVLADVFAARGIIARRGIGKVRHLDTSNLWIQELAATKRVKHQKVGGTTNPADMMTKDLPESDIREYIRMIGVGFAQGRADIAA